MPYCRILILCAFILGVSPAFAGEATYVDMRGKWQSTQCQEPQMMMGAGVSSEAAADDLNTKVMKHNQFVAEAKAYMECVSDEATRDAHAMSYLATESAKILIEKMQDQITQSSFHAQTK